MGFKPWIKPILIVTLQMLLNGHKMFNFLFVFFLKISETLKANISEMEADIDKRSKSFFLVFKVLSY